MQQRALLLLECSAQQVPYQSSDVHELRTFQYQTHRQRSKHPRQLRKKDEQMRKAHLPWG